MNEQGNTSDIAIIGVGFKGPGAENLEQLWDVLKSGRDMMVDIPKERWNVDAFYDPDPQATGKYYSKKAGLLSNPYEFDNGFFNITDMESDQMDPQQKLVLECTYRAMENAGITRSMLEDSKTGVYIGAMNCDYRGMFPVKSSSISNYTVTGVSNSIIAARISYTFDLLGPAMVIDTGCSSALVAIHTASHALLQGDCSAALCGGTNFMATPDIFVHLSKAQMLSPSGHYPAFSDLADGYTRGEGCGIVILKKLCDAERDQDKILAIIKTGTNQDGHDVTPISAPSKTQQIRLLEDMYRNYSMEQINEVEYIEAHGTGTQAGDLAEAHALGEFFNSRGSSKKKLIGSIKTNIGHLEAAAGVAGLIKVLLMMEHSKIVPSLFSGDLNKKIDFDKLNLTVVSELRDWTTEKKVASVNSFGFGGSNCHAIVKSFKPSTVSKESKKVCEMKTCVVCFSGKNSKSLQGSMVDFLSYPNTEALDVHDIAFTSTNRRSHYRHRAAFVVDSLKELNEKLRQAAVQKEPPVKYLKCLSIVFVFGGMGTCWGGMCKELLSESEIFSSTVSEIDECLNKFETWSLKKRLMKGDDCNDVLFAPLAIFTCQVALARLWLSLGVKPAFVVGQSVGEVAAAYISGNLSLQDAVQVIYKRSLLLSRVKGGKMFIVRNMDIKQVKDVVTRYHSNANISVEYSPVSCAVSCEPEMVENIQRQLQDLAKDQGQDIQFTQLAVPTAYHSHCMDEIKAELSKNLSSINPREHIEFTMVSTVTGNHVKSPLGAKYWEDNLREPVLFYQAVKQTCNTNSSNIYIEIGPKPVLQAHIQDIFTDQDAIVLTSMTKDREWRQFLESVASLYCRGVDIDWKSLQQYGRVVTPIPRYCFQARKGFFKSEAAIVALSGVNYMRLQHPYVFYINTSESLVMISPETFSSVYEHKISGELIIPGALYPEIGFALSKLSKDMKDPIYTVSAEFKQPFRISREGATVLSVECLKKHLKTDQSETVSDSYTIDIKTEEATFATLEMHPLKSKPVCPRENIQFLKGKCSIKIKKEEIYTLLKTFGFTYGPKFSLLKKAYKSDSQCLVYMTVPDTLAPELSGTTLHPSVIDSMIQASVILLDENEKAKELFPRSIGSLTCYSSIQHQMCIIATKKGSEGDLNYYDIKLTKLDGQIVATMNSLTHKTLTNRNETVDSFYKCVWTKHFKIPPKQMGRDSRVLIITDTAPATQSHLEYCIVFNLMEKPWEILSSSMSKINNTLDFIVISIMTCDIKDTDHSDAVLEKTLNLCLFLKELYNCVFSQRLHKPVFLFTKGALALENVSAESDISSQNINPILTSAWGMLRCALREPLHDEVMAIDVHLHIEDNPLTFFANIAEQISNDPDLRSYPEFILTKEHLYVNQIVKLGNQTKVPNYRLNNADNNTNYLILSNQPDTLESANCVYIREFSLMTDTDIEVKILEAAIQNLNLYNLSIPCCEGNVDVQVVSNESCLCQSEDGFLVYTVEYRGEIISSANQKINVVSCFPVPLASKVVVPKMVTIDTNMFYQYKLGDVTQLTVLMALCSMVKTSSVTVVASKSTFHLAQCLDIMLKTFDSSKNVNIVMIEQFHKTNKMNETVIFIVMIDRNIISTLKSLEEKPKEFITVYTLMKDARSLFSVALPSIHLDLLDTVHLFSRSELINSIPRLTKLISEHKPEIESVLRIIHGQAELSLVQEKETLDLRKLFENECKKLNNGYLKAGKGDLFRKDSLYIVVGGLTGLGWLTVVYLAKNRAGCIAILNRRTASDVQKSTIAEVSEKEKCQIEIYSGDASNFETVEAMIKSLDTKFPNRALRGVFFSAAVLEDKPLLEMTREDFYKVLLPKVKGAWNMHLVTKNLPLDYFVLYSSITSVVGNINQTNYGAGNAFMDGLALRRRSLNLASQSVNWGALDLGLLKGNVEARKTLESKGFILMSEDETVKVIEPLLLLNLPIVMPCLLDEKIIFDRRALDTPIRLQSRLKTIFHGSSTEEVKVQDDILRELETVREKPRDQRLLFFEKYICDLASQVLGLPQGTLNAESRLSEFSIDSIVTMTMKNHIYKQTGCRVHPIIFLDGLTTINKIAEKLDELYNAARTQNQN